MEFGEQAGQLLPGHADAGIADGEAQGHAGAAILGNGHPENTFPASVNLIALPARLTRICTSRSRSPTQRAQHLVRHADLESDALGPRDIAENIGDGLHDLTPARTGSGRARTAPASILEKSRISSMTRDRCSAERRIFSI